MEKEAKSKYEEGKHFKGPDRFKSCTNKMKSEGHSAESADKICGAIKQRKKGEVDPKTAKGDMDFGVTSPDTNSKGEIKKPPTKFQTCKKRMIDQGFSKAQASNVCGSEKKDKEKNLMQGQDKKGGMEMKIAEDELSYQNLDNIRGQLYDFAQEILNPEVEQVEIAVGENETPKEAA